MGEAVHCESFIPLMRDQSEDSNSYSWSMYSGDKNLPFGQQYQKGFSDRAAVDAYSGGYEKDLLKQTMLEHESIFKNQVSFLLEWFLFLCVFYQIWLICFFLLGF